MEGCDSESRWAFWASPISSITNDSYGLGLRYTVGVLLLISTWQFVLRSSSFLFRFFQSRRTQVGNLHPHYPPPSRNSNFNAASTTQLRNPTILSDSDLKFLIDNLDDKPGTNNTWENVVDKRNDRISYTAKCCKQKDGPLKYLSVTVFNSCSPEVLRDFYMDNEYRKMWDKTVIEHRQLEVDVKSGTEIGQTIKKFPLLTPREYVLAWRVWKGQNQSYYCFSKECEHPLAPRQKKYVRVGFFRSGWKISEVPGQNACEIKMVHQEDSGLNVDMAKIAFAKGIWSYVCKMDNALRKYSACSNVPLSPAVSAITLMQKVPPEMEVTDGVKSRSPAAETSNSSDVHHQVAPDCRKRKLSKRPSKKLIANGLILLGGALCLSRGHSDLGAKVAMAYILSKFTKRGAPSAHNGRPPAS